MHTTAVVKYTSYHYLSAVDETARCSELRSSVKVEVAVLGSPSLMVLMVSVDVKQH